MIALLRKRVDEAYYLEFLRKSSETVEKTVQRLLSQDKSGDAFDVRGALTAFRSAIRSGSKNSVPGVLNAHLTLLNRLDALETMLEKARGDTGDILQMVRWQARIYSRHPNLPNQKGAQYLTRESNEFIQGWASRKNKEEAYATPLFKETVDAVGSEGA